MTDVKYRVTLGNGSFETTAKYDESLPMYVFADEAYKIALMFAETQYIARYGHPIDIHEFAEMLKELDYSYEVNGVEYK